MKGERSHGNKPKQGMTRWHWEEDFQIIALLLMGLVAGVLLCLRLHLPDSTTYIDAVLAREEGIPNTNRHCPLHEADGESDIYLLYVNTGKRYDLSVLGRDARQKASMSQNTDAWSGTAHQCERVRESQKTTVRIYGIQGVALNLEEMKEHYCDDCIRKMLEATRGSPPQILIVDPRQNAFYPITYSKGETSCHRFKIRGTNQALCVTVRRK